MLQKQKAAFISYEPKHVAISSFTQTLEKHHFKTAKHSSSETRHDVYFVFEGVGKESLLIFITYLIIRKCLLWVN